MLGLCPLLAIVKSISDGLIFGGFFVLVLFLSTVLASGLGSLVPIPVRRLFFPLVVAMVIVALGFFKFSPFYAITTGYGVYLGLMAANCLILEYMQAGGRRFELVPGLLQMITQCGGVWIFFVAFGALRDVLATGHIHALTPNNDGCIGGIPLAVSPAGAFILLGLIAAVAQSLQGPVGLDKEVSESDGMPGSVP